MRKAFYNRLRHPVLVLQYALTTKAMPWTVRFRAGTIFVDFRSDRTHYSIFFHTTLHLKNFIFGVSGFLIGNTRFLKGEHIPGNSCSTVDNPHGQCAPGSFPQAHTQIQNRVQL